MVKIPLVNFSCTPGWDEEDALVVLFQKIKEGRQRVVFLFEAVTVSPRNDKFYVCRGFNNRLKGFTLRFQSQDLLCWI